MSTELVPIEFSVSVPAAKGGIDRLTRHGLLVPETQGLFVIDERKHDEFTRDEFDFPPSFWVITHVPTGFAGIPWGMELETRERAITVAQNLYRELLAIGSDILSNNPAVIVEKQKALSKEEQRQFWARVLGESV